jgi:hypothetical protein
LECVAYFDDGSQREGTFDADNQVTFTDVSGNQAERVEIVVEDSKPSSSITEALVNKLEDHNYG